MKIAARIAAALVVLAAVHAAPAPARAEMFGVRLGYYTDVEEPFLGGELLLKLAPRLYLNPNVEAVLVDNGRLFTLNGDVHYDLPTGGRTMIWVGAGLAVINADPEGPENGDTDLGANFFAGLGRRTGRVIPYAQAKIIAKDDAELVLAVGIRF
jgi:hypothetical protein